MKDEPLVARILHAVVNAVDIPVTLKMRTGWSPEHKNAVNIAHIAESEGIAMLTVHGRTRADAFRGEAEYDTIAEVKQSVQIPVIANGDITSAQKAKDVMKKTGADGVMIGRASYGNPWIFSQIAHELGYSKEAKIPNLKDRREVVLEHMRRHYDYYGADRGAVTIRKHLLHYLDAIEGSRVVLTEICQTRDADKQMALVETFFEECFR